MFEMEQTLNLMEFLEACPETFRLAKMNLAARGISHNLGPKNQSTFEQDFHRGTKMDYIIANPPFNLKPRGMLECEGRLNCVAFAAYGQNDALIGRNFCIFRTPPGRGTQFFIR